MVGSRPEGVGTHPEGAGRALTAEAGSPRPAVVGSPRLAGEEGRALLAAAVVGNPQPQEGSRLPEVGGRAVAAAAAAAGGTLQPAGEGGSPHLMVGRQLLLLGHTQGRAAAEEGSQGMAAAAVAGGRLPVTSCGQQAAQRVSTIVLVVMKPAEAQAVNQRQRFVHRAAWQPARCSMKTARAVSPSAAVTSVSNCLTAQML